MQEVRFPSYTIVCDSVESSGSKDAMIRFRGAVLSYGSQRSARRNHQTGTESLRPQVWGACGQSRQLESFGIQLGRESGTNRPFLGRGVNFEKWRGFCDVRCSAAAHPKKIQALA